MTRPHLCFTLEDGLGRLIAGVDEAGRGPLAGTVVAAAVVLDPERPIAGLADSKRLSEQQRAALFPVIVAEALAYAVAQASVDEIDRLNILQATLLAMTRAVAALPLQPDFVYVDGNRCPAWRHRSQAVVKGDGRVASVAAASILAKVTRDRELVLLDAQYPGYGFAQHKGYPTESHLQALRVLGPSPAHRRSFAPVAAVLQQDPAGG
ncbi:MAG: ribonuclease HII [Pseudohongiellaceae bacterium]|jgi:ribonuclease HII